jgi:co-chaperonin GroES (HSP10)
MMDSEELVCIDCGNEKGLKHETPFKCPTCGGIKFPLQPLRSVVYVYPDIVPEKIGAIIVPNVVREEMWDGMGIVLAIGKGHYDKDGHFHPTQLKVGQRVRCEKTVPWFYDAEASDGNMHRVKVMSECDIYGLVV